MGGPHLMLAADWSDCRRCERSHSRIGVVAPLWSARTKILLLDLSASPASQVARAVSPRTLALASAIAGRLGLAEDEVTVDLQVACGMGPVADAADVAACAQRHIVNIRHAGPPMLVIFTSLDSERWARASGALQPTGWGPVGTTPNVPTLTFDRPEPTEALVAQIGALLGIPVRPPAPDDRAPHAERLFDLLGKATGHGVRALHEKNWKRYPTTPLTVEAVCNHLRGVEFVAPFHPREGWRYVVVDIDRHDAVQAEAFEATLAAVREALPTSLFFQSSTSGGVHAYVHLPPDTQYDEGATWVEAFFALKGLRWLRRTSQSPNGRIDLRTNALEVPIEPPRLPFGAGSQLLDSREPFESQFARFESFVERGGGDDFQRARDAVCYALRLRPRWSREKRLRLERYIRQRELDGLGIARLPPDSAWNGVLTELPKTMQIVATQGVPAIGTRTRWTLALIDTLENLIEPEQVGVLMREWLSARAHQSEDISTNLSAVLSELEATLRQRAEARPGVPAEVWNHVLALTNTAVSRPSRLTMSVGADRLRRVAFHILQIFYSSHRDERSIPRSHFAFGLTRIKDATLVRDSFLRSGWLVYTAGESHFPGAHHARRYRLHVPGPAPSDIRLPGRDVARHFPSK